MVDQVWALYPRAETHFRFVAAVSAGQVPESRLVLSRCTLAPERSFLAPTAEHFVDKSCEARPEIDTLIGLVIEPQQTAVAVV